MGHYRMMGQKGPHQTDHMLVLGVRQKGAEGAPRTLLWVVCIDCT